MAVIIQLPLDHLRETFPFLPITLVGIGMLAMLWLLRRSKKKSKAKPRALNSLERTHAEAIREIASIKMNQAMDKRLHALKIPRSEFPVSQDTKKTLKQIAAYQNESLSNNKKPDSRG